MRGNDGDLARVLTFVELMLLSFATLRLLHLLEELSQVYPVVAAGSLRVPLQWLEWPALVLLFLVAVGIDRVLRPYVSPRGGVDGSGEREEADSDMRPDCES